MHAIQAALSARGAAPPAVAELLAQLGAAATMDVQITSFGGVGSTTLSNFLNAHGLTTNLLTDADNLRHCPRPPPYAAGAGPLHVVYLVGAPLAAVASHYRRGHACHQAQKTNSGARLRPESFPATLREYVDRGEDLFGLEAHVTNWLSEQTIYPIVLLRYDAMFEYDVCLRLFSHLCSHKHTAEAIQGMAKEFSQMKAPRCSQVPPDVDGRMYQPLLATINQLPALSLRTPDGQERTPL